MDSNELIHLVTAEVFKRLGAGQPTPQPSPSSPLEPSRRGEPAQGRRVLVLLTGGNRRLDEVVAQVGQLVGQSEKTRVALSPSAQKVLSVPALRRAAPQAEIVLEGDAWQLLEGVGIIAMPNMSLHAATQIRDLSPDSLVCILAIYGLMRGIPILAARDSWIPAEINPASVPRAIGERLEKKARDLEAMGVRFGELADLSKLVFGQAPATTKERSGSPCSLTHSGECSACGKCVEHQPTTVKKLVSSGADRVGSSVGVRPAHPELANLIDHTLLKPDATESQIRKLCEEAKEYRFASVCVNPSWVGLCAKMLAGTGVKVCTVIGFPLGATTPTAKAIETRDAIANGANEIDMVINVGALKSGDDELVRRDIESVVAAAKGQAIVKVILETALLSKEEIIKACLLAKMAGADFVKTSTGFSSGGATVEHVALMRATVGPDMGIKAAGGIRDRETAEAMVAAGATRIGASASVAIATGNKPAGKGY